MAGSLAHLVDENGAFTFDGIDNLGDAWEACEECFDIIAFLADGDLSLLREACRAAQAPTPDVAPILGARSKQYRRGSPVRHT